MDINTIRAEALFLSNVQPSAAASPAVIRVAVVLTERRLGVRGCVCAFAREYGEHPDTAAVRMAWAVLAVAAAFPARQHNAVSTARAELAASA